MMMFRISSPLIWTPSLATQTGILVSKSVWKKWYIHCQYSFYYRLGPLLESIIKQLVENSFKSEITFFPIASTWNFIKKPEVLQTFAATYFIKETVSKSVSQFKKKKNSATNLTNIYSATPSSENHQSLSSLKGATKSYFMHYLWVIIFFSLQVCIFYLLLCKTSFLSVCFFCFSQVLNWCHTYIKAIWLSVIFFSLYKNYFLFIKVRFWHMLVKTCFQRSFELIKNHL